MGGLVLAEQWRDARGLRIEVNAGGGVKSQINARTAAVRRSRCCSATTTRAAWSRSRDLRGERAAGRHE
jgi:hypothetical protein